MKPVVNNQDDESNCVDGVVEQSMRDAEYQQTVQNEEKQPGTRRENPRARDDHKT